MISSLTEDELHIDWLSMV